MLRTPSPFLVGKASREEDCTLPRRGQKWWGGGSYGEPDPPLLLLDFSSVVVGMLAISRKLYDFESAFLAHPSFESCKSG